MMFRYARTTFIIVNDYFVAVTFNAPAGTTHPEASQRYSGYAKSDS
jgi:hypothetical protein